MIEFHERHRNNTSNERLEEYEDSKPKILLTHRKPKLVMSTERLLNTNATTSAGMPDSPFNYAQS